MVMRSSTQSVPSGGTWKGVLFLLFLTTLSVLSVDIFGRKVSFIFLPLTAIFLWPRIETPIVSIVFILVFGLLVDILSSGPLGLWALIFLSVFTLFGPYRRLKPYRFIPAFRLWLAVLVFTSIAAYFLGWFSIGRRPDIWALLYQAVAAIALFPFVYSLRYLAGNMLSDTDRRGP